MRILTTLAALFLVGAAVAQDATATKSAYERRPLYPMTTCVVSGEPLEADAVKFEAAGQTFLVCCNKCKAKIEADPAPFAKKLDEARVQQQLAAYPLDVCVVTGKKLGSMGEPVKLVLDGTLVQLCCKGCVKKAEAAPQAMAKKVLDAAYAAQSKTYPLDACVVTGEKLGAEGEEPVSLMLGTTLVKLCCNGCIKKVEKDPAKYLAMVQGKAKVGNVPCEEVHKEAGEAKEGKKEAKADAGDCGSCGGCSEATPAAKPVEKAKAGDKPAAKETKTDAGDCGSCGGCSEATPAAKPVEKAKTGDKAAGSCCPEGTAAQKPAAKETKTDAGDCGSCGGCSEATPAAKPVEKAKVGDKAAGSCCPEGSAAQKPAAKETKTDAGDCGSCGGCSEATPAAKPVEKAKAEPKKVN